MVGIVIALVGLALTILGLVIKLTIFSTQIGVWVDEMRKEVRRVRPIELRVALIEQQLEMTPPSHLTDDQRDS